jgi:hypothetical protein
VAIDPFFRVPVIFVWGFTTNVSCSLMPLTFEDRTSSELLKETIEPCMLSILLALELVLDVDLVLAAQTEPVTNNRTAKTVSKFLFIIFSLLLKGDAIIASEKYHSKIKRPLTKTKFWLNFSGIAEPAKKSKEKNHYPGIHSLQSQRALSLGGELFS